MSFSESQQPHFSDRELSFAERVQEAVGHSRIARAAVSVFTGSSAPGYVQLDWRSVGMPEEKPSLEILPADPDAGMLARDWKKATILAADIKELDSIRGLNEEAQEAVAYISDATLHVGSAATMGFELFQPLGTDMQQFGVAMRQNRGHVQATMGLWVPGKRKFIGATSIRTVTTDMPLDGLTISHPRLHVT